MKTVWGKIMVLAFFAASTAIFTASSQDTTPPDEPVAGDLIFEDDVQPPERPEMPGGRQRQLRQQRPGHDKGNRGRERLRQRHQEYIEWLGKNYPEDANELETIREKNPQLYMRKLMHSRKKYGRIAEAAEHNPELAQVLKENAALKDERDTILKKMQIASDDEKEALNKELNTIVAKRFDLIVKRKQLQHEQLLKKLEKLKERVKESEAEVEKWKTSKDERVKERVKEIIGQTEKFHWD